MDCIANDFFLSIFELIYVFTHQIGIYWYEKLDLASDFKFP